MNIEDFAWLVGTWRGSTGGDAIDETWSAPAGGTLMGMFRWLKGEAVYLYEFLVIKPHGDRFTLLIKHFNAELLGREEKDQSTVFDLVSAAENIVVFENVKNERRFRLTYQRQAETLTVTTVVIRENTEQRSDFVYQRVP